jgi:hypothetical protein
MGRLRPARQRQAGLEIAARSIARESWSHGLRDLCVAKPSKLPIRLLSYLEEPRIKR